MKKHAGKKRCAAFAAVLLLGASFLAGCRKEAGEAQERTPTEFSVVPAKDAPGELAALIEEKKEHEIRLTWTDGEDLYLVRGYGKQETGGYSISVAECSEDAKTVWFDTTLIGPQEKEGLTKAASNPYLIVKIKNREKEVLIE